MVLKLVLLRSAECPECDRQRGIWDQVKREAPGQVEFREVLMDGEADAVRYYKARDHPTIVLEKDGKELKRWMGVTNKTELLGAVHEHLDREAPIRPSEIPSGPSQQGAIAPRGAEQPPPSHVPPPPGPEPMPGPPGQL
jgi:thioredoxin 1